MFIRSSIYAQRWQEKLYYKGCMNYEWPWQYKLTHWWFLPYLPQPLYNQILFLPFCLPSFRAKRAKESFALSLKWGWNKVLFSSRIPSLPGEELPLPLEGRRRIFNLWGPWNGWVEVMLNSLICTDNLIRLWQAVGAGGHGGNGVAQKQIWRSARMCLPLILGLLENRRYVFSHLH